MKKLKVIIKRHWYFHFMLLAMSTLCLSLHFDSVNAMMVSNGQLAGSGLPGSSTSTEKSLYTATLNKGEFLAKTPFTYFRSSNMAHWTINGETAFCIDVYIDYNKNMSLYRHSLYEEFTFFEAITVKRILNYVDLHKSEDNSIYAIAQALVWGIRENVGVDLLLKSEATRDLAYQAYAAYRGFVQKNGEYPDMGPEEKAYVDNVLAGMCVSSAAGTFYVYYSACGNESDEWQRYVTKAPGTLCIGAECEIDCGEEGEGCNNTPTVSLGGKCEGGSFFDDTNNWECIQGDSQFKDTSIAGENNPYCTFFCRETVNFNFPASNFTFYGGQYFTIGSSVAGNTWGPISVYGIRNCRSYYKENSGDTNYIPGIDWTQFLADIKSDNNAIKAAYNKWKTAQGELEALKKAKKYVTRKDCNPSNNLKLEIEDEDLDKVECECANGGTYLPGANKCFAIVNWTISMEEPESCSYEKYKDITLLYENNKWYVTRDSLEYWYPTQSSTQVNADGNKFYPRVFYEYNANLHTYGKCVASSSSYSIDKEISNKQKEVNSLYNAYRSLTDKSQAKINNIKACAGSTAKYNLNPVITYRYDDSEFFKSGTLTSSGSSSSVSKQTTNKEAGEISYSLLTCTNDGGCKTKSYTITGLKLKNVTSNEITITSRSTYTLGNTGYRYALKSRGQVIGSVNDELKGAYVDLGDDVIPLSYTLKTGYYNIVLNYSNIGHNGYFDKYVSQIGGNTEYVCPFYLKNDILGFEDDPNDPDYSKTGPIGLDIIYRPIQLGEQDVAFPSIDGDGRKPGSNWIGTTSTGQSYVDAYITYNRGVDDYEVYDLEPLYTIEMTPTVIKKIREYNKNVGDYNDFNLTCTNGKQCYSSFIHSEFDEYIGGSCGDSGSGEFNSCVTSGGGS